MEWRKYHYARLAQSPHAYTLNTPTYSKEHMIVYECVLFNSPGVQVSGGFTQLWHGPVAELDRSRRGQMGYAGLAPAARPGSEARMGS